MTELSRIRPDRDAIVEQLETALTGKDAWKDRVVSSTGKTLVDLTAAVGAYAQYSIESAYQEVWPESAKNKESLYAASNFLGVRYNRKSPAEITVSLTHVAAETFAPFTQFTIAGTFWFNRNPISATSTPTNFTLYQGKIVQTEVNGLGTNFQAYVSPETSFQVSDTDVRVTINGDTIPAVTGGLWTLPGTAGAQQFTIPSGQALVLFGNNNFGSKPGVNDVVNILYAVTFGADGNNLVVQGKKVAVTGNNSITGTVVTSPASGANETDPFVYKNTTPALAGAFDSSVTPAQYKALPLLYPGVIDAQTFAQREINPKALTWMSNIRVVLLTNTTWTANEWDAFVAFMNEKSMYKCQFIRKDPVVVPVSVSMDVYCANFSNLTEIQNKVIAAIQDLFAPRQGILGFDYYRSDIEVQTKASDSNIDYLVLTAPTLDIVLSSLNVSKPTVVRSAGGSLASGTFDYAVSAVSVLGGETAPANWTTVSVSTGSNTFTLTWPQVPNVSSYKIWGRSTGFALGLLGTVDADDPLVFIDTGAVTPTGLVPVEATIDSYYATLDSLTVNMYYSTRPKKLDLEG